MTDTSTVAERESRSGESIATMEPGRLRRFTVPQYDALGELPWFDPENDLELIDGLLVRKMVKNPNHVLLTKLIQHLLTQRLPPGWHAAKEDPLTLSESKPEPDVTIVRGDLETLGPEPPSVEDVALVIEVADRSLAFDLGEKAIVYARDGIAFYLVVDIPNRRLHLHERPTESGYQSVKLVDSFVTRIDETEVRIDGRELFGRLAV